MSLLAFACRKRSLSVVAAAVAGVVAFLSIMRSQPYLRYLYAAFPLFTVAAFASFARMQRLLPRLAQLFAIACTILLTVNMYFFAASGWTHRGFAIFEPYNRLETDKYIADMAPSRRLVEYLNLRDPGASVWFLGPPQIAELIGRPFMANWYQPNFDHEVSTAKTAPDLLAIVKAHGLRYFLVPAEISQINNIPAIRTFATDYLVKEWQVGAMTLARLRDDVPRTSVFSSPSSSNAWADWQRNGRVEFQEAGIANVTLTDTLVRGIVVNKDVAYRYTVEASCPVPDTTLRLQINWHNAAGTFIATSLEPRSCDAEWHSYATSVRPPADARTGVVIVGGHGPKPVFVRHASLEF
jgi:hypothetical protein